jgi:hypothetical protein
MRSTAAVNGVPPDAMLQALKAEKARNTANNPYGSRSNLR